MINFLKKIWQAILDWFIKKPDTKSTAQPTADILVKETGYSVVASEELPDNLKENTLYLIGEQNEYWMAALMCPCKCNEIIKLNLLPDADPSWKVVVNSDNSPTINPSIWRIKGCRSHFILKRGKIIWCK